MSIFNNSKYTNWYQNIILAARNRNLFDTYAEIHHIIPKCLGGDNSKDNLVKLTAREHFICHLLLTKMTSGSAQIKMCFAFNAFRRSSQTQKRFITGHQYEVIRRAVSAARSQFLKGNTYNLGKKRGKMSEETKKKIRESKLGKSLSADHKRKISQAKLGKTKTEETKQRMRKPKSVEHKEKIRKARIGTTLSNETRLKISESHKNRNKINL